MVRLRRLLLSRAWLFAIGFGLFAYLFHKVGAAVGFYPRFFWFQMLAHFISAAAMALLLARFGIDSGLRGRWLVAFVVAFSAVGALAWEVTEYYNLWRGLHWWGIEDSLLDLGMDALGVFTVIVLFRTRIRPVIHPQETTPPVREVVRGDDD